MGKVMDWDERVPKRELFSARLSLRGLRRGLGSKLSGVVFLCSELYSC